MERPNLHHEAEALVAQLLRHLVHAVLDGHALERVLLEEAERVLHGVLLELAALPRRRECGAALRQELQHVRLPFRLLLLAPHLAEHAREAELDLLGRVYDGLRGRGVFSSHHAPRLL